MPLRSMTESPARTRRCTMSTSISPSLIVGTIGHSTPRRGGDDDRSRETLRATTSPPGRRPPPDRTPAASSEVSSARQAQERRVALAQRLGCGEAWSTSAALMVHVDHRHLRLPVARIVSAAARSSAARTTNRPWLRVSSMRSTSSGRSCRTSARRASDSGARAGPVHRVRPLIASLYSQSILQTTRCGQPLASWRHYDSVMTGARPRPARLGDETAEGGADGEGGRSARSRLSVSSPRG